MERSANEAASTGRCLRSRIMIALSQRRRRQWPPHLIGTPADIADAMEEWFHHDAADGFNILPPWLPGGLEIVDMVVPELQRRGLYRTAYEGSTLRENLGILYGAFGKVAYRSAAD